MGISIDLWIYDRKPLEESLKEWGANNGELLHKILDECGYFTDDKYIILNNEYGDRSPYFAVAQLLDSAFRTPDSFDVFLKLRDHKTMQGISYVDVDEIAEEMGIEIVEED